MSSLPSHSASAGTSSTPAGNDREAIRDEKVRIFKAMRALDPLDVLRGQFRGYREQSGGAVDSSVETFAAVGLASDTWRWAGVPFSAGGRRLPVTVTEVMVTLNPRLKRSSARSSYANRIIFAFVLVRTC